MTIPSKASTSAPGETDQSWIKHAQVEIQKEPERLEETAKFLAGIISISLTIYISNHPEGLAYWKGSWFIAATMIWVMSTLLCFFVLFPWRYRFNKDSSTDIQRAYRSITRTKRRLLIFSLGCFLVALVLASYAFLMG